MENITARFGNSTKQDRQALKRVENRMEAILREHVSVIASFIGWIIGIISCALPWWKVIINGQPPITLEGIWMRCVQESDQEKRCVYYKSTQEISTDLLAARFCCISSIVLGMLGVLLSVVGSKCTNCTQSRVKLYRVFPVATSRRQCNTGRDDYLPYSLNFLSDQRGFCESKPVVHLLSKTQKRRLLSQDKVQRINCL
ncbi:hypothetical protein P4O66_002687 [Electrophorus voltai]|uniref:Claudin n=1 Tax=Electrophorus voltai TaxID=2609070 RepID=A0AAD9DMX4_9TELE|nr:hypothetical protein P4O66_002687 [Electrophorus voltai]